MAFFWPLRNKGEPAETQEDPYDDNNQKPKRLRKESSSSDDNETKKHFGHISGSSSDSSDSEGEEEAKKIEEITEVNEEEDEYEVKYERFYRFDLWNGTNIKSNGFFFCFFTDIRKGRNAHHLPSNHLFLLSLVRHSLSRCR